MTPLDRIPRAPLPPFPTGFLWGSSTSAHQVEGGNRWNDWWQAEQAGRLPHASGEACQHFERYAEDFDLARSLGHNAHRLSLEWSRIEPEPGQWNRAAIEHYRSVIQALRDRALEPMVTLHHFTSPAWLAARGGFERRDAVDFFERYVERVARELGDAVTFWIPVNEPTVYTLLGWIHGEWPPFARWALWRARRVLANLARAHVAAYRVLHTCCPAARVGVAHSAPHITPCNPRRMRDRVAARIRDHVLNEHFFRRIGARAGRARHLDFIGLNYYTRTLVSSRGLGAGALFGRACKQAHHRDLGEISQMGWEVHAPGLTRVLERFATYGVPLYITENGLATEDEELRRRYLGDHLASVAAALQQGIDVRGYFWWSLLDNFEWALGTAPRFGMVEVDYQTQERRPRPVATDFQRIAERS